MRISRPALRTRLSFPIRKPMEKRRVKVQSEQAEALSKKPAPTIGDNVQKRRLKPGKGIGQQEKARVCHQRGVFTVRVLATREQNRKAV